MRKFALTAGVLFTILITYASTQTAIEAAELEHGEWRLAFAGIQKAETVKVNIKTESSTITVEGTSANLGIIFKTQSGSFQPTEKSVKNRLLLTEPIIITVRRNSKELMKINADKADIQYRKSN